MHGSDNSHVSHDELWRLAGDVFRQEKIEGMGGDDEKGDDVQPPK